MQKQVNGNLAINENQQRVIVIEARENAQDIKLESGAIHVVEADYRYDLTDIPSTLLDAFRECGICLNDLEEKLKGEVVVYGVETNESFSD